mgnify:CR=1 FL=1
MFRFSTRRQPHRAHRAWLLLAVFLTSWAAYALNARWLTHEMSAAHTSLTPLYHDHLAAKGGHGKLPFSDAEHKLLHGLSHFAEAPAAAFEPPAPAVLPEAFTLAEVMPPPAVALEPPRHPPRHTNALS